MRRWRDAVRRVEEVAPAEGEGGGEGEEGGEGGGVGARVDPEAWNELVKRIRSEHARAEKPEVFYIRRTDSGGTYKCWAGSEGERDQLVAKVKELQQIEAEVKGRANSLELARQSRLSHSGV